MRVKIIEIIKIKEKLGKYSKLMKIYNDYGLNDLLTEDT